MKKTWKDIVLYVSEAEQTITISHSPEQDYILLITKEINGLEKINSTTYLEYKEARELAKELVKWCDEFEIHKVERI